MFQITVVIERILAFSLSSPLAKFLNGLEILLSKSQVGGNKAIYVKSIMCFSYYMRLRVVVVFSQDWENNASRTVSLRNELETITQLIIQWRKLELK